MRKIGDAEAHNEIQESRITHLEDQLNATRGELAKARRVEDKHLAIVESMQGRIDSLDLMVEQLIRRGSK